MQHFSTLGVICGITYVLISWGRRAEEPVKSGIGQTIAGITFSTVIIDAVFKMLSGTFDLLVDLPFFMCDLVALMLPFVLAFNNRKWIGILYFWALAGTLQAILTPDLQDGFPSFHFFRYFIGHAGIIAAILYTVVVGKVRIGWQDFVHAIIYAQVYLVCVHVINILLHSNYSYTLQKPPVASLLDMLGSWPWYLLWGEVLMVVLFLILLIPFKVK